MGKERNEKKGRGQENRKEKGKRLTWDKRRRWRKIVGKKRERMQIKIKYANKN